MAVEATKQLEKQPSEKRQYTMDFSNNMSTSETISSINSVASEMIGGGTTDLTIDSPTIVGQTVTMWISGGTHHKRYRVEVTITTSTGAILQGDGILKLADK